MDQALKDYVQPTRKPTRLVPNGFLKQTTNLVVNPSDSLKVEEFLGLYPDLVPAAWIARHAKFVYHFGYHQYEKNAAIARTKTYPQGYMAKLISISFQAHGITASKS